MSILPDKRAIRGFLGGKKIITKVALPLFVLIFVMLWLTGAFQRGRITGAEKIKEPLRAVPADAQVITVELTPREIISEMIGEVKPEFKINVSSQITANIIKFDIRAGARVKKGQELILLDDRDVQARLEQTKESLARAAADLDYARSVDTRSTALLAQKAISQLQYDQDHSKFLQAEAEVKRLRQALQEAQVSLSYTRILSPVDGVVIDRLAEVGDLATPGKPLLTMFDPRHLWLQASVREDTARLLELGREYTVRVDALDLVIKGPLVEIVPSADALARTVYARVRLPMNDQLYPGMFGRLLLPTGRTEDVLIPQRALRRVGQLDMVDVKTPRGLEQRAVVVGRCFPSEKKVEILCGLKPGEMVMLQPTSGERLP